MDVAGGVQRVGRAAARAVQPRPAILAVGAGVDIAELELIAQGGVGHAVPDIAQLVIRVAHKLVAGVEIAPRGHGHILGAGAAARDALVDAGAVLQIQNVMVEGDRLTGLLAAQHVVGQQLILVKQLGQILLGQRLGGVGRRHNRLHRQLTEAEIVCHMEQVLGKINIVMRKGAAHIVALAAARLDQLLELGHDAVIAAVTGQIHAEAVVDLLAAVERKHNIMTFLVAPVDDLVGNADAVGRHRKAEVLVILSLDAARIGNQLLADLEVHQRLTAEEIDLQIAAGAGVFDQKVQRALAGLKAHQTGLAVELALRGKAVAAVQVAGVGHMQAERLDHIGTVFKVKGVVSVGIGRKQLAGGGQLVNVVQHIVDVGGGHIGAVRVLFGEGCSSLLPAAALVDQGDGVIGDIVHRMHAAAVDIQHNVVTA